MLTESSLLPEGLGRENPITCNNCVNGSPKKLTEAKKPVILVYPFDAKGTELSVAAYGLMELGGDLLGFDNHGTELNLMIISPKNSTRKSGRKHYMTI